MSIIIFLVNYFLQTQFNLTKMDFKRNTWGVKCLLQKNITADNGLYESLVISAISGIDEFDYFSILSVIEFVDFVDKLVNVFIDNFSETYKI